MRYVAVFGLLVLAAPVYAGDEDLIKNAVSAAPAEVGKNATVMNWDMKELQKGSNGFTCFPNDPTTPTNDPMCVDPNGLEWVHALMEKKEPPKKVGFGYMLQGESAASNVDPFAQPPTDMKDLSKWHQAGPHIMIFNPAAGGLTGYVKPGENADVTQPWVMWAGSPYEHLMIPTE
jgi:hypothetical protein